ncbi:hypothetical protein AX15_001467 [Amanita polypyramis BW_CC]|nr:hypothetical protein AX15_001467 [Amanita polypyramis BW_CC]
MRLDLSVFIMVLTCLLSVSAWSSPRAAPSRRGLLIPKRGFFGKKEMTPAERAAYNMRLVKGIPITPEMVKNAGKKSMRPATEAEIGKARLFKPLRS